MRSLAVLLAMAALACAGAAHAQEAPRIRGLIVGASHYDAGGLGLTSLSGPRNDALLMADFLRERGAERGDLILLTDGIEQADYRPVLPVAADGPATRAEIEAGFRRLARTARPGDQVVILLSGHGWRQLEAVEGSEPDGVDELFLPSDYGPLSARFNADASDRVPGALTDNEIGAWIDAIRDTGADVLLIADFCHSGDSARGEPDLTGRAREPRLDPPGDRRGGYAAFFAAPAGQRAMQGLAPIWAPREARAPHGLITVYAVAALRDPSVGSYADAAARIQASLLEHDVRDRTLRLDAPAEFEGELDRPVLGAAGRAGLLAWTVEKPALEAIDGRVELESLSLNAGALHGLAEGSLVALTDTSGGQDRVVLYGRATEVTPTRATLTPAAHGEIGAEAWRDIRTATGRPYTDRRLWAALLVERGVDFEYRVARPRSAGASSLAEAALAALSRIEADDVRVRWVDPGEEAELHLHLIDTGGEPTLSLSESANPAEAGATLGSIPLAGAAEASGGRLDAYLAQAFADALLRAARAHRLKLILAAVGSAAEDDPADGLRSDLYLWRPARPAAGTAGCSPFDPRHAELWDQPPPDAVALSELGLDGRALTLRPCDVIFTRVRNAGDASLDVTALAFSPDGAIWALPWADDRSAVRFEPGRARLAAYQLDAAGSGSLREELVLIAVEADALGGAPVSFARLQQPGVASRVTLTQAERTRSEGASDALSTLLEEARFGETRSGSAPVAPVGGSVRRFSIRVAD